MINIKKNKEIEEYRIKRTLYLNNHVCWKCKEIFPANEKEMYYIGRPNMFSFDFCKSCFIDIAGNDWIINNK